MNVVLALMLALSGTLSYRALGRDLLAVEKELSDDIDDKTYLSYHEAMQSFRMITSASFQAAQVFPSLASSHQYLL